MRIPKKLLRLEDLYNPRLFAMLVICLACAACTGGFSLLSSHSITLFKADESMVESKAKSKGSGDLFRDQLTDGSQGPEMIVIPIGKFFMGDVSNVGEYYEKPVHKVWFDQPFALGKTAITFAEYDQFTQSTARPLVDDYGWGRGQHPIINVNLEDAQAYIQWLSKQTGGQYYIPSEAEFEYASRAGTTTAYYWGDVIGVEQAHCNACGSDQAKNQTAPVGRFAPNAWGLYDMAGNVWELTADCWNFTYAAAPTDGSASKTGDCTRRVLRGGSWGDHPRDLRTSTRLRSYAATRTVVIGFRVARKL